MKTIKQRISYAVMGLMAMGFTACTQNEDMAPTLKGQEINVTFSAVDSDHVSFTLNVVVYGFNIFPSVSRPRYTRILYEISLPSLLYRACLFAITHPSPFIVALFCFSRP